MTRCPTLMWSTSGPTSTTSPIDACPSTVGGTFPSSPRQLTTSVEQNGDAPVRTSTRPGAGSWYSMSSTTNGSLNSTSSAARTARLPVQLQRAAESGSEWFLGRDVEEAELLELPRLAER